MGRYCFIEKCNTTKYKRQHEENDTSLRFFGFPNNPVLREKWIKAIATQNRQESVRNLPKYSRICILHFTSDCIENIGYSQVRLKSNAVPTIFPHVQNQSMMQLPTLYNEFSNSDINDTNHSIPQSTKHLKTKKLTIETDSNSKSANTEVIADQWINEASVNEASVHPEFVNDSQQTSSITEKKTETSLPRNVLSTPKKIYRYPGDIKDEVVDQMSPKTKSHCIRLLKSACKAKDKSIKSLMVKEFRHKKKIASLKKLLSELRQKCGFSENASEIIEITNDINRQPR